MEDGLDTNTSKIRLVLHRTSRTWTHHRGTYGRGDGKPEYLWEYEAFDWARKYCQQHGIVVPTRTVDYEREIIAEKAHEWVEQGSKRIDPVVACFILEKNNGDPDLKWAEEHLTPKGRVKVRRLRQV
jgi:hypothetical protein